MYYRAIKKSKVDYFERKFESCRGNLRNTWRNLKYLMNTQINNKSITTLKYRGTDLLQSDRIAEAFSEYFAGVATKLNASIPRVNNVGPTDYLGHRIVNSFYASPTSITEVEGIINAFPTKGGYAK